jgi:hypothetical protein
MDFLTSARISTIVFSFFLAGASPDIPNADTESVVTNFDQEAEAGGVLQREKSSHRGSLPPKVETRCAKLITFDHVQLSSYVTPNNADTTVWFEYGTDAGYGSTAPVEQTITGSGPGRANATVGGLMPNTTYHYRAVAMNAEGISGGSDIAFTTVTDRQSPSIDLLRDLQDRIATLDEGALRSRHMQSALINILGSAIANIALRDPWLAQDQLRRKVLDKADGCAITGAPDPDDWVTRCDLQDQICELVNEAMSYL